MRTTLLIAGFIAAVAVPAAALAQPYDPGCVQANHDNHVAGTVVGGVAGAILGGAITGGRDRGLGALGGAAAGAVAGNAISRSNDHPCPDGYTYGGPPPEPAYADRGFWAGAPRDITQRIDFMQDRINRAAGNGWISPREDGDANRELRFIRSEDQRLHYQDGQYLQPQDRDYLQGRLDALSQRLHWDEHTG